jgi:hypothetical protein
VKHLLFLAVCLALAPSALPQDPSATPQERLQFTEADLPSLEKDPAGPSEIDEVASRFGFNYARDTRRAAHGDVKALRKFFQVAEAADGAAAEIIQGMPTVVYHLLGDEKFSKFLAGEPLAFRMMVRNQIPSGESAALYLRRFFPLTTKILFRRELVEWPSPDGRYAIRKVFSDDLKLDGSKVVVAELIEKEGGRVLCDLTPDDIGTGPEREGEAMWSSDSKRVACLSSDLTPQEGNPFSSPHPAPQRRQTAVYQRAGENFVRVSLTPTDPPDRETDEQLKDAVLMHRYTEPLRWKNPNVLLLRRHEYYRKIMPTTVDGLTFDSIHDLERQYQITATFDRDGKATVHWRQGDSNP